MNSPQLKFWWEWHIQSPFWPANEEALRLFGYGPIELERLGLPDALMDEIDAASAWHDSALNWEYPPDPGPWRQDECDRFNATSKELFERCQQILRGNFEVIYAHADEKEDPDLDAYLSAPRTFKRQAEQTRPANGAARRG